VAEALGRMRSWFKLPGEAPPPRKPLDDNTVMFGYRYHGPAVVAEDGESGTDLFEDPRHPTARPGSRAPHVWLSRAGDRLSTVDLFGRELVLLAGPADAAWHDAAQSIGLTSHQIGAAQLSDVDGQWATAYGVKDDGAVLVRPDGYVAWRSTVSNGAASEMLRGVVAALLGKAT
jgi:putative polyketide hydroxylase